MMGLFLIAATTITAMLISWVCTEPEPMPQEVAERILDAIHKEVEDR